MDDSSSGSSSDSECDPSVAVPPVTKEPSIAVMTPANILQFRFPNTEALSKAMPNFKPGRDWTVVRWPNFIIYG